jgi:hypothetical protein
MSFDVNDRCFNRMPFLWVFFFMDIEVTLTCFPETVDFIISFEELYFFY